MIDPADLSRKHPRASRTDAGRPVVWTIVSSPLLKGRGIGRTEGEERAFRKRVAKRRAKKGYR